MVIPGKGKKTMLGAGGRGPSIYYISKISKYILDIFWCGYDPVPSNLNRADPDIPNIYTISYRLNAYSDVIILYIYLILPTLRFHLFWAPICYEKRVNLLVCRKAESCWTRILQLQSGSGIIEMRLPHSLYLSIWAPPQRVKGPPNTRRTPAQKKEKYRKEHCVRVKVSSGRVRGAATAFTRRRSSKAENEQLSNIRWKEIPHTFVPPAARRKSTRKKELIGGSDHSGGEDRRMISKKIKGGIAPPHPPEFFVYCVSRRILIYLRAQSHTHDPAGDLWPDHLVSI